MVTPSHFLGPTNLFVYQKYKEKTCKNGKIYLVPVITKSNLSVSRPKVEFKGLFNGDEKLSAVTNKAINDNAGELYADLKPVIEQVIDKIAEDLVFKALAQNIPVDDLFPIKQ